MGLINEEKENNMKNERSDFRFFVKKNCRLSSNEKI